VPGYFSSFERYGVAFCGPLASTCAADVSGAEGISWACPGEAAAGSVLAPAAAGADFTPLISDRLWRTESRASVRQVKRNITESMDVSFVIKLLVFVPKTDSIPEKDSISPPPLPDWTRIIQINKKQTTTCIPIIITIIFLPLRLF
jgi:hypothetical protein